MLSSSANRYVHCLLLPSRPALLLSFTDLFSSLLVTRKGRILNHFPEEGFSAERGSFLPHMAGFSSFLCLLSLRAISLPGMTIIVRYWLIATICPLPFIPFRESDGLVPLIRIFFHLVPLLRPDSVVP